MRAVVAMAVVVLLNACGQIGGTTASKAPSDAAAVLEHFKATGLPIGETVAYTPETDPNSLLGRPGGYTSKASWRDTRVPPGEDMGVSAGGSVEMYADAASARQRGEYVSKIAASSPAFTEYTMAQGRIVLRLSKALTPEQVEQYRATLAKLPG